MSNLLKIALFLIFLMFGNLNSQAIAEDREDRLAEAQKNLEEATREYAELASELGGDNANHFVRSFAFSNGSRNSNKARLGINIGETSFVKDDSGKRTFKKGRADGVEVLGISPGSPAEKVGLRAGDVITAMNGQTLLDNGDNSAVKQLTEVMSKVTAGDAVDVMYVRDGITQSASITTDEMPKSNFKMLLGDKGFNFAGDIGIDIQGLDGLEALSKLEGPKGLGQLKVLEGLGDTFGDSKFIFISKSPLGDAELVELSPELGEYFGAKSGLLLVKAPSNDDIDLRDGDVILSIDGREPNSVSHAMRIMRSYESGDDVKLEILRKKRKRSLSLTIPEISQIKSKSKSFHWNFDKSSESQFPQKMKKRIKVIKGLVTT